MTRKALKAKIEALDAICGLKDEQIGRMKVDIEILRQENDNLLQLLRSTQARVEELSKK